MQIWFPCLEELILVVGAECDFRKDEICFVKPRRQPWHYRLRGFGPICVDSKTTWCQIEDEIIGMVAILVEDRTERTLEIFDEMGIDRKYGK